MSYLPSIQYRQMNVKKNHVQTYWPYYKAYRSGYQVFNRDNL